MNEAMSAISRLQAVMRQGEDLRGLLADVSERARAAAELAAAQSVTEPVLFICAVRLAEIAAGASRGAQVLAGVEEVPAGAGDWPAWIRRAEHEAVRLAGAGRELERLSEQASLLALDANLRAWRPVAEIAAVAEQLRQASQKMPGLAAETIWAAEDAARRVTGPA